MNVMKHFLVALFLSVAMLFSNTTQAMEIRQFDKMAVEDQADYITLLVEGAQKVLIEEGKKDLAAKVHKLFTEIHPGDTISLGMEEFETNLAQARLFDAERHAKDHDARRLEVKDAIIVTLKRNDIVLPKSFMTVGKNFKPKHPPKEKK